MALAVFEKAANLLAGQWSGEPLHVVFHENLHGGALDGTSALNRLNAAPMNVGAQENCDERRSIILSSHPLPQSPIRNSSEFFGASPAS